jgi:hypothetical protein
MRRIFKSSLLCLAAGVVIACRPDEVIQTENIPTAGVRFINAVPDTMPLDFRFVDLVESNAHFRITFRNSPVNSGTGAAVVTASTTVQYKNARAGTRQYKIFLNDTIQDVASTVIDEGQLVLAAGSNYTFIIWGWADPAGFNRQPGSPPMTTLFLEETVPDPGANVALRVINATRGPIDGRVAPTVATLPGTATWASVASLSVSPFVTVAPDTQVFNIRPEAGAAGTELFANARALVGVPPNSSGARNPTTQQFLPCVGPAVPPPPPPAVPPLKCDIEASPGTTIAGSAVTAIVFPGSTACSRAPQVSPFQFTTGSIPSLGATATGYSRVGGSFTTDGFAVGQTIGACGFFQGANNGLSTITGVTATTLTVTKTGGTVLEAGTPTGTAGIYASTTAGYTRTTGSFVTDGFVVGMTIRASGFTQPASNGISVVSAVTATTLTVTKTPAPVVEAATTGLIGLAATTTGYTRSAGDFVAEGWVPGMSITAAGFVLPANNGTSLITGVTAGALTVTKTGGTADEPELPARSISSAAIRSFGNSIQRQIAAERPFISFVWDRRPPRPLGM